MPADTGQSLPAFKIAYVSGPVDARKIHADALAQREPEYFGTSYLAQLIRLVRAAGGRSVVVTTLPELAYDERASGDRLINIPPPTRAWGVRFHLAMLLWSWRALRLLWRERPDVAVLTASQNYLFMLAPLRLRGTRLVVSLHCALWPKFGREPASWRWLRWLNKLTVLGDVVAIQCVSADIREQVRATVPGIGDRVAVFRPTYDPRQFGGIALPQFPAASRFRVLFVGRIEANKGPFDLLEAARLLRARADMPAFAVDFAGEGAALDDLRAEIRDTGLDDICMAHGVCSADAVRALYTSAHIVVVPTRSDFEEGYNKVCAEAILARRPLVTSAACPALDDVREASVEARVDDVDSYADAIHALATDATLYREKVDAADRIRDIYFDVSHSYAAVLTRSLARAGIDVSASV
jgi:glycogen synthase